MSGLRLSRCLAHGPLVPAALAAMAAVAAADGFAACRGFWPMAAAALLGACWIWRRPSARGGAVLLGVAVAFGCLHAGRLASQQSVVALIGRDVTVAGLVVETPKAGPRGPQCRLAVRYLNGRRMWLAPAVRLQGFSVPLEVGSEVRLRGVLAPVPAARNPGEFDLPGWLHRQGAAALLEPLGPVEVGGRTPGGRLTGMLEQVRAALGEGMTAGLDPQSGEAQVIRAMALGEAPPDAAEVVEMFRFSGTLHVFAVSGLHVGMVGGLLWLVLRGCGVSRRVAIVGLLGGMFFYAGVTGLRAPALRAALMAAVFLGGFLLRRKPQLMNSLSASLLLVLGWDSHQLFTPGFQLSYGVLGSIGMLGGVCTRGLGFLARGEAYLPRVLMSAWQQRTLGWRRKLAGVLGMSAAATAGSAPLSAVHFSMVCPLAVVAGLPVMALVWVVVSLALLASLVAQVWLPGAVPINRCNARVANLAVAIAGGFADLPGGHFRWNPEPAADVVIFDLPRGAAACHLNFGGGTLLDAGSAADFRWTLHAVLKRLNLRVDSLVLSHPDGGHVGGMAAAVEAFAPRQVLLPVVHARSPGFRRLQAAFPSACVPLAPGARFPLGDGAVLEVLYLAPAEDRSAVADDRVMVLALERAGWRILFTSDAGPLVEKRLLDSGANLRADVLVMGRHWSGISGTDEFLAAVAPQLIIASHADFPASAAIPAAWAAWLKDSGISLMRQDLTGAVTLRWTPEGLRATGLLGGARVSLATPRSALAD